MENFIEKYNVSHETFDRLQKYLSLLNEWQAKFNLVSKNSLPDAWNRHFEDSAQLYEYLPENAEIVYDFGSGAGFPALVLAAIAKEKNQHMSFVLFESIGKKSLFLNTVINELGLNAMVINGRIESQKMLKADVITARALGSLDKLLEYAQNFCKNDTVCIFPKGKSFEEEIIDAQRKWSFSCEIKQNKVCSDGVILYISKIRRKK